MYEQAGIPESWIIDPCYKEALCYVLAEDKQYHRHPADEKGYYRSKVLPRFSFEVNILFRDPPPSSRDAVQLADTILKGE